MQFTAPSCTRGVWLRGARVLLGAPAVACLLCLGWLPPAEAREAAPGAEQVGADWSGIPLRGFLQQAQAAWPAANEEQRQAILAAAAQRFLSAEGFSDAMRAGDVDAWCGLADLAAPSLPASVLASAREAAGERLTGDPAALAALDPATFLRLGQALRSLTPADPGGVDALAHAYIADPQARWRTLDAGGLAGFLIGMDALLAPPQEGQAQGAAAGEAVRTLVSHAHAALLADGITPDTQALAARRSLVYALGSRLSDGQREAALAAYRALFEDGESLKRVTAAGMMEALLACDDLGMSDPHEASSFVGWCLATERLEEAAANELFFPLMMLAETRAADAAAGVSPADMEEAADRLLHCLVSSTWRIAEDGVEPAAAVDWYRLMREGLASLPEAQARELDRALARDLADPELLGRVLEGPSGWVVWNLVQALDPRNAQEAVLPWLTRDESWRSSDGLRLAQVYRMLSPPLSPEAETARERILGEAYKDLSRSVLFVNGVTQVGVKPEPVVVEKFLERFHRAVEESERITLEQFEDATAVVSKAVGLAESNLFLVDSVLAYLQRGGQMGGRFRDYKVLGQSFTSDTHLGRLRDNLLRPDGGPNFTAAQLLSWAYSARGQADSWRGYLEQRGRDADLGGDQRALWLLARGYAAQVVPADLSPLVGFEWVEKALAEAQSEAVLSLCLEPVVEATEDDQFGLADRRERLRRLMESWSSEEAWSSHTSADLLMWHYKRVQVLRRALGSPADEQDLAPLMVAALNNLDFWHAFHFWEWMAYPPKNRYWGAVYGIGRLHAQTLSPQMSLSLRAALAAGELRPTPNSLFLLAWDARARGELDAWKSYLDDRIEAHPEGSEERRGWLVGRAYAEELTDHFPAPLRGKRWIDMALGEASSEQPRAELVTVLFQQLTAAGLYAEAASLVEGMGPQFESAWAAERFAQMADMLPKLQKADTAVAEAEQRRVEIGRIEGRLSHLRSRLAAAPPDSDEAVRVKNSIRSAEAELKNANR